MNKFSTIVSKSFTTFYAANRLRNHTIRIGLIVLTGRNLVACERSVKRLSMAGVEGGRHRSTGEAAVSHEADDRHRYTRKPREQRQWTRRVGCDMVGVYFRIAYMLCQL
jgi:hypothetical protein